MGDDDGCVAAEVYRGLLGISAAELAALKETGVCQPSAVSFHPDTPPSLVVMAGLGPRLSGSVKPVALVAKINNQRSSWPGLTRPSTSRSEARSYVDDRVYARP